jgi:hypothetical protein
MWLTSPAYTADRLCGPVLSELVEKLVLLPAGVCVLITVPPSRNCIFPPSGKGLVTVAVIDTVWPNTTGVGPASKTVVDETLFTTSVVVPDVLVRLLLSPE